MKKLLILLALLIASPAFAQAPQMRATVNGSITITLGNTFQQVFAAATSTTRRNSLTIQNNNATDSCWLFIGPTASATKGTSILLLAGQPYIRYYPYIPSDVIAATCASTNDTLYADTQ